MAAGATKIQSVSNEVGTTCFCNALGKPTPVFSSAEAESTPKFLASCVDNTVCKFARRVHDCPGCISEESIEWKYSAGRRFSPSSEQLNAALKNRNALALREECAPVDGCSDYASTTSPAYFSVNDQVQTLEVFNGNSIEKKRCKC